MQLNLYQQIIILNKKKIYLYKGKNKLLNIKNGSITESTNHNLPTDKNNPGGFEEGIFAKGHQ